MAIMLFFLLAVFFTCGLCRDRSDEDLGYSLTIGHAIDVFANYGDLSQVTQVVSADYEEEDEQEPPEIFKERNIKIWMNASSTEYSGDFILKLDILLCDTFEDLLKMYFQNFTIEGIDKPWKAFLGDWAHSEITRALGITQDISYDECCYVLVKLSKVDRTMVLQNTSDMALKDYIEKAIDDLDTNDISDIRKFMSNYGTHYIDYFITGNFIYQVFIYKRTGYNLLRMYIKGSNSQGKPNSDNWRFYFSSIFLKQVGDIRVASGNKLVESWARKNLRDSQYLYSRPSLLRLHYNPVMAYKLNLLMEPGALLGLGLKTLRPIFKDTHKGEKFSEIVENDLNLWEINS